LRGGLFWGIVSFAIAGACGGGPGDLSECISLCHTYLSDAPEDTMETISCVNASQTCDETYDCDIPADVRTSVRCGDGTGSGGEASTGGTPGSGGEVSTGGTPGTGGSGQRAAAREPIAARVINPGQPAQYVSADRPTVAAQGRGSQG